MTSLLHRIYTHPYGILVQPTLTFDERGHQPNAVVYAVLGAEGNGAAPTTFFPELETFIGPGGSLDWLQGEPYPLGVKRDGTPRIVQRWMPDPETWDLRRQAWKLRVNGTSHREIHERTGILGSIGSYATFFRNRIHTGTLVYGRPSDAMPWRQKASPGFVSEA